MTHEQLVERVATAIRDELFGPSSLKVRLPRAAARAAIAAVYDGIRSPAPDITHVPLADVFGASQPHEIPFVNVPAKAWPWLLDYSALNPKGKP